MGSLAKRSIGSVCSTYFIRILVVMVGGVIEAMILKLIGNRWLMLWLNS